MPSQYLRLL